LGAIAVQLTGLASARSLIAVAVTVEITLVCSLLLVARDERRLAQELIVAGRSSLPLAVVAWERSRLIDSTYRYRLAGTIDRIVTTTEHPRWLVRGSRPLFRVDIVAAVAPELTELGTALRNLDCEAAGVAMTQRLLCDGDSPLYGDDIFRLRETVRRIHSHLSS
jgi:hypothetical protein